MRVGSGPPPAPGAGRISEGCPRGPGRCVAQGRKAVAASDLRRRLLAGHAYSKARPTHKSRPGRLGPAPLRGAFLARPPFPPHYTGPKKFPGNGNTPDHVFAQYPSHYFIPGRQKSNALYIRKTPDFTLSETDLERMNVRSPFPERLSTRISAQYTRNIPGISHNSPRMPDLYQNIRYIDNVIRSCVPSPGHNPRKVAYALEPHSRPW